MSEPIKLPEALRLADVPICQRSLEWQSNATAELRRLYAEVERLREAAEQAIGSLKSCSGVPHWPALQQTITTLEDVLKELTK